MAAQVKDGECVLLSSGRITFKSSSKNYCPVPFVDQALLPLLPDHQVCFMQEVGFNVLLLILPYLSLICLYMFWSSQI